MGGIDPKLFASTFAVIFLAELPDKTVFAILLMATRKHPAAVFLGAATAFVVQSAVAVAFGRVLSALPAQYVRVGAGLLFLALAAAEWREAGPAAEELRVDAERLATFAGAIWSSFAAIFLLEWGDMTQLATATLAAKHANPLTVFLAATLALWCVTALAVLVGSRAKGWIKSSVLHRIAAAAFGLVGLALLFG